MAVPPGTGAPGSSQDPGKQDKKKVHDDLASLAKALAGGSAPPPSSGTTHNQDQIAVGMFKKYAPAWMKSGYYQTVISYAHLYHLPVPYLAALFIAENKGADPTAQNGQGSSALGLAQILDTTLNNYNKGATLTWGQGHTLHTGDRITDVMKKNPAFAIAYAAWRLAGALDTYGNLKDAYQKGYHGQSPDGTWGPDLTKYVGNYVPSKSDYNTPINTKTAGAPASQAGDPYVTYNAKTGKVGSTLDISDKNIVEFEGFPMTSSSIRQQLQDKNGLGGDIYSFTGQTPTIALLAGFMSAKDKQGNPLTVQQIENSLIDSKYFMNSPTGKKYSLSYQSVYQGIMGADAKLPTGTASKDAKGNTVLNGSWAQLVKNAAKNNLSGDEFAVQIRNSPGYLNSNEFKQNQTTFQDSYEHIYGPMNENAKRLASDAALSGWNVTQWEHYLRSQPSYTKTPEYKSHALSVLDSLGLSFGFLPSLKPGAGTDPVGANALGAPDTAPNADTRVKAPTGAPTSQDASAGLGVNF